MDKITYNDLLVLKGINESRKQCADRITYLMSIKENTDDVETVKKLLGMEFDYLKMLNKSEEEFLLKNLKLLEGA